MAQWVFDRHRSGLRRGIKYFAVVLLIGVLLVAVFGIVALIDEAVLLAVTFLGLVYVPVGVVALYSEEVHRTSHRGTITLMGISWGGPFLVGLAVMFAGYLILTDLLGLAPGESRQLGLQWSMIGIGTVVVVLGSLWLARRHVMRCPRVFRFEPTR